VTVDRDQTKNSLHYTENNVEENVMICFVALFGLQPGFKKEYQEMYNSKKPNSDIHVRKNINWMLKLYAACPETEQVALH
jgi:hypothetical protein